MNLDLLLATANEPTLTGDPPAYPSAETVALAWQDAMKVRPLEKPDAYFWENKKHGTTTFQDHEIEMILSSRSSCSSLFRSIFVSLF